ncbi:MAG TPA: CarD family transcriptional regulator [Roseiarcus sp.]|nr:CarD family transcriptional regulator [Roseiarcus sp.]
MAARKTTTKKSTKSHGKNSKGTSASKISRRRSTVKSSNASKKKNGSHGKAPKENATKGRQKAASLNSFRNPSSKPKVARIASLEKGTESKADTKRNSVARSGKAHAEAFATERIAGVSKVHSNEVEAELTVKETSHDQKPLGGGASPVVAKPRATGPQPVAEAVPNPARANESGKDQRLIARDATAAAMKSAKSLGQRQGFKLNEYVVYPAHGVGQIIAIEDQEVAGFRLELFVINFSKDKMTLRVPTSKVTGVGLRKISDPDTAKRSLEILTGRARIKRTMWSRRAQEYETKINSGDIRAIAEVVRDLYRSEAQPEQSYSERQLYEAALDRMVREIAAVQRSTEIDALKMVEAQLEKGHTRNKAPAEQAETSDGEIEEAA